MSTTGKTSTAPNEPFSMMLLEDEAFVSQAIAHLLRGEGACVHVVHSPEQAVTQAEQHNVTLAILDLQLHGWIPPTRDYWSGLHLQFDHAGFYAAVRIQEVNPSTRILYYSAFNGLRESLLVQELGHSFVWKREHPSVEQSLAELIKATHIVRAGGLYRSPTIAANLAEARASGIQAKHCIVLRLYADGYDGATLAHQLAPYMGWAQERSVARRANELLAEAKETLGLWDLPKHELLRAIHNLIDAGQL